MSPTEASYQVVAAHLICCKSTEISDSSELSIHCHTNIVYGIAAHGNIWHCYGSLTFPILWVFFALGYELIQVCCKIYHMCQDEAAREREMALLQLVTDIVSVNNTIYLS